ncbi:hypothetical protein K9U40_19495 [Xanthobacter autotrophicus]|uniref:hypothetical protein n=1 Tax=Xanthobacter TaxID=279 RepID=UPI0024AA881B|nr:hypothetical protein [Xanthobacter autotrophicus]MDI4666492.1 hypothetical protein [Xanthobacter autotrophicus]
MAEQTNAQTDAQTWTRTARPWSTLYADASLKRLGLPAFTVVEPGAGIYRHPMLVWSAVHKAARKATDAPYLMVCCDVLVLDEDLIVDRPAFIIARRIETGPRAGVIIDRIAQPDPSLLLMTQQIVEAASGKASALSVTLVVNDAAGTPIEIGYDLTPASNAEFCKAIVLEAGESVFRGLHPGDAGLGIIGLGEQPALLLETQFQLASLRFTEDPGYARQLLFWIVELLSGNQSLAELALQARALYDTVSLLSGEARNGVLVPALDHAVYADQADQCLKLLTGRDQRLADMRQATRSDRQWLDDARVMLADRTNELDLNDRLVAQARRTRDQAEEARSDVLGQLLDTRLTLERAKTTFDMEIERWKRAQMQAAAVDLVTNSLALLSKIPAIVVGAGDVGAIGQVFVGDVTQIAGQAGKMLGADQSVTRMVKGQTFSSWAGKIESARGPFARLSKSNRIDQNANRLATWAQGKADSVLPKGNPLPPRNQAGANPPPAAAPDRDKADDMRDKVESAAGDAKGIFDAAMRLKEIGEAAEAMEQSSAELLGLAEGSIGDSLSTVEPAGIDIATGGAQLWQNLAIDVENMFENLAGGDVKSIPGAIEYRLAFRKLFVAGQAMSVARLALAKANTDLAVAILRKRSAARALDTMEQRVGKLGAQVAEDETVQNALFERVVEAKRGVFLAMEAYRRAFCYFSLIPLESLPALPRITDSVDDFSNKVRQIAGRAFELEAVEQMTGMPSTTTNIEIVVSDPVELTGVVGKRRVEITVPDDSPAFKYFARVRVSRIRVYAEGVTSPVPILVRISSNGIYRDCVRSGPSSSPRWVDFSGKKFSRVFVYKDQISPPLVEADTVERFRNDVFRPTPFTTWTLVFERQDGAAIDLTGLSAIRMQFSGECSAL